MNKPIETYSTVQLTSKRYKMAMLLGWICIIGAGLMFWSGSDHDPQFILAQIGLLLAAVILFFYAGIGRWWTNQ